MKCMSVIMLLLAAHSLCAQERPIVFRNNTNAYYNKKPVISSNKASKKRVISAHSFSATINEIRLNTDSTFTFLSMPRESCFTWQEFKGTWYKQNDTLMFTEKKQLEEMDVRSFYNNNTRQSFLISFKTDKGSPLQNRQIKVQYIYDFGAHLEDIEQVLTLKAGNTLEIPFQSIPHLDQLAALKIEYLLNFTEKREGYLTQNKVVNKKERKVPNLINVEFVEKPLKEVVYRTTKAVWQNDTLTVVSTVSTKSRLVDYGSNASFEDVYTLANE